MSDSSEDDIERHQFKVIILGDGAVGKTSIAMRHTDDHFSNNYKQTIGLDFFLKKLKLPNGAEIALQIWDIGGQSIGGKMLQNYIYGAHAVLLVYDITNYESFQNLEDWYRLVRRTFDAEDLPKVALIGNKVDLNHIQAVPRELHDAFLDENDMFGYYVSAKTGDHINTTFYYISALLAGIVLTKAQMEGANTVLPAKIVNHVQNDQNVIAPDHRKNTSNCSLM